MSRSKKNVMNEGKWIQKMHLDKGALRKKLHVKEGQNIPLNKLDKAMHSKNPLLKKEAVLANTFRKSNHE